MREEKGEGEKKLFLVDEGRKKGELHKKRKAKAPPLLISSFPHGQEGKEEEALLSTRGIKGVGGRKGIKGCRFSLS